MTTKMTYAMVDANGADWGYAVSEAQARIAACRPGETIRELETPLEFEHTESGLRTDAATGARELGDPFVAIW